MPHRTRHLLAAAASLSAVALPAAPPALASPHEFNGGYRQQLHVAGAIWSTQTETTSTSLELQVFERTEQRLADRPVRSEPVLALFYDHSQLDPAAGVVVQTSYTGSSGPSLTFEFDPSLLSGAAVRDSVEVTGVRCSYPIDEPEGEGSEPSCVDLPRDVLEVDLTWAQTGVVHRDTERMGGVVPPEFAAHARDVTAASSAVVTGEVTGGHLQPVDGPADHGMLLRSNYLEHLLVH